MQIPFDTKVSKVAYEIFKMIFTFVIELCREKNIHGEFESEFYHSLEEDEVSIGIVPKEYEPKKGNIPTSTKVKPVCGRQAPRKMGYENHQSYQAKTLIEKLVQKSLTPEFANTVILMKSVDLKWVLEAALKIGIKTDSVIRRGSTIYSINLDYNGIVFRNIDFFFDLQLIPKNYYYPHMISEEVIENKTIPSYEYFQQITDSSETLSKIESWVNNFSGEFVLREQAEKYLHSEAKRILDGIVKIFELSFDLQSLIRTVHQSKFEDTSPYSYTTLSSLVFNILTLHTFKQNDVRAIFFPNKGVPTFNASEGSKQAMLFILAIFLHTLMLFNLLGEIMYSKFYKWKHGCERNDLAGSFVGNGFSQERFMDRPCDIVDTKRKLIIQFNGCKMQVYAPISIVN